MAALLKVPLKSHFLSARNFLHCPRKVSTLSGVFNKFFTEETRKLDSENSVGLFGIPELKSPDGFHIMKEGVMSRCTELIQDAIRSHNSPKIVSIFDEISDELCKVADLAEFVRLTHPSKSYAKAAEETSLGLGAFVEKLNTNLELYKALKFALSDEQVLHGMDDITKHVGNLFLFDFEQSGIHLEEKKRNDAVRLHEMILTFGAEFSHNTATASRYPLQKWAENVRIPFRISGNEIIVTSPCSESTDGNLRKEAYKGFFMQSDSQLAVLENLFACRNSLANLLGFDSFSHRALRGTMAEHPETVNAFLHESLNLLHDSTKTELEMIRRWKSKDMGDADKVQMWDVRYIFFL